MKKYLLNSRFRIMFYAIVFVSLFSSSFAADIRIGLTVNKNLCRVLEKTMNKSLKNVLTNSLYKKIVVSSVMGYNNKRNALLNNNVDILESGFGLFYEMNSMGKKKYDVLLHACYYNNINDPFYIRGVIFSRKEDNLSFKDIKRCKNIFAVSPSSSSGYYIQKAYLQKLDLSFVQPVFVSRHPNVKKSVIQTKGSMGFCGNFVKLDPKKFKVLYRSILVPGGLIYSRSSIENGILKKVKNELAKFYLLNFRDARNRLNRFFVAKLQKDYFKYFQLLQNGKASLSVEYIIILALVLILVLIMLVAVFNRHAKKKESLESPKEKLKDKTKKQRDLNDDSVWRSDFEVVIKKKKSDNYRL